MAAMSILIPSSTCDTMVSVLYRPKLSWERTTMARKPGDKVGLMLRFDEALRRAIARSAKAHNRSMNAEIVQRLMTSFQREEMEAFLGRHAADAAEKGAERAVVNFLRRWVAEARLAETPEVLRSLESVARKEGGEPPFLGFKIEEDKQ